MDGRFTTPSQSRSLRALASIHRGSMVGVVTFDDGGSLESHCPGDKCVRQACFTASTVYEGPDGFVMYTRELFRGERDNFANYRVRVCGWQPDAQLSKMTRWGRLLCMVTRCRWLHANGDVQPVGFTGPTKYCRLREESLPSSKSSKMMVQVQEALGDESSRRITLEQESLVRLYLL